MNKELITNKGTTKGLLAVTALGAAEGAGIGLLYSGVTYGLSPFVGGFIGGTTAFTAEATRQLVRRNQIKNEQQTSKSAQEPVVSAFSDPTTQVDITVESTSTTRRTDVPEEESTPIVKTASEQAQGVPLRDISGTLTSLRERLLVNAFPAWQTTIEEKTIATANGASEYTHSPKRVR